MNLEALNQLLFLYINAAPGTHGWVIDLATVIAEDLIYLIPVMLMTLWLSGDESRRSMALKACAVTLLSLGLNQVVGLLWPHPRPFVLGLGQLWLPHAADPSFPSDHATVFASVGICLLTEKK